MIPCIDKNGAEWATTLLYENDELLFISTMLNIQTVQQACST